ncbi:MAG: CDP-alcohol phosphatidyltransferase family protein [Acidimicrobiaceae bacterium]|nr:CDP-alcohol phosphatidyltransferase family protein [Acidimicrobiaceae bacterium]
MDDDFDAGWRTWPNLVTALRLAAIPFYVLVLFTTDHRALAAWMLGVLGATDWIDGYLARRLHQTSTLGKIIDPTADRVLVMTGLITVALVHAVPWWFAGATLAREIVVSGLTLTLAALGAARIDVLWWGKVSTFILMATYPAFLLTSNPHRAPLSTWQHDLRLVTWLFAVVGLVMAYLVGVSYVGPARRALAAGRAGREVE